jgi:hypothetical protein
MCSQAKDDVSVTIYVSFFVFPLAVYFQAFYYSVVPCALVVSVNICADAHNTDRGPCDFAEWCSAVASGSDRYQELQENVSLKSRA